METVVDNQWLVLLGILLLMGSGSAWNYCLLLTCCNPRGASAVALGGVDLSSLLPAASRAPQLPSRP